MPLHSRIAAMRHIPRADRWQLIEPTRLRQVAQPARDWISWPDSLTERLAHHLGDRVVVRVLSERHDRLSADERQHLGIIAFTARIREVQLEVRGVPYVVARTVFPESTARVMNNALSRLGNRSLGSLLFGAHRAPVSIREFNQLTPGSALWQTLRASLPIDAHRLWARRALHLLNEQPLLVTEVFLPHLLQANVTNQLHTDR